MTKHLNSGMNWKGTRMRGHCFSLDCSCGGCGHLCSGGYMLYNPTKDNLDHFNPAFYC